MSYADWDAPEERMYPFNMEHPTNGGRVAFYVNNSWRPRYSYIQKLPSGQMDTSNLNAAFTKREIDRVYDRLFAQGYRRTR